MGNKNFIIKFLWLNNTSKGPVCPKHLNVLLLTLAIISLASCAATNESPLVIQEQGSFAVGGTVIANPGKFEQGWYGMFRIGIWPDYFEGVQFSRDAETLNQYFRAMMPSIGPIDVNVNAEAVSALFNKIGPAILVTHSHSGGMGWLTAIKSNTHFPFSDINNIEIADLMSEWLKGKGLDKCSKAIDDYIHVPENSKQ